MKTSKLGKILLVALFLMLFTLVLTVAVGAETKNVAANADLSDAIGSAAPGDVLVLGGGTYTEADSITIGKNLTIQGSGTVNGGAPIFNIAQDVTVTFGGSVKYTGTGVGVQIAGTNTTVNFMDSVHFEVSGNVYSDGNNGYNSTVSVANSAYFKGNYAIDFANGGSGAGTKTVTMSGGTFACNHGIVFNADGVTAKATITGGTTNNKNSSVYNTNVGGTTTVEISNVTFASTASGDRIFYNKISSGSATFTINSGTFNAAYALFLNEGGNATLNINGGTLNSNQVNSNAGAIFASGGAHLTVNATGGTINATRTAIFGASGAITIATRLTATVDGATATGRDILNENGENGHLDVTIKGSSEVTVSGGLVSDGTATNSDIVLNIQGGKVKAFSLATDTNYAKVSMGVPTTLNVSGGELTLDVYSIVQTGLTVNVTGTGVIKVGSANVATLNNTTAVAQIGNTPYDTLEAAIAAAAPGDTITILKNCTVTTAVTLNKRLTFTGEDVAVAFKSVRFTLADGADITFDGSVSWISFGATTEKSGTSKVTVNGGTFVASAGTMFDSDEQADLTIEINGGTFNCTTVFVRRQDTVDGGGTNHATTVNINDGTFNMGAQIFFQGASVKNDTLFYVNIKGGDFKLVIDATNATGTYTNFYFLQSDDWQCKFYITIEGGTFTAHEDAYLMNVIGFYNKAEILDITLKGGTFTGFTYFIWSARQDTTLSVPEGCSPTVSADYILYDKAIISDQNCGKITATIYGGTFTATNAFLYVENTSEGTKTSAATATVTIYGGIFSAKHIAQTVSGTTKLTLNGGTFTTTGYVFTQTGGTTTYAVDGSTNIESTTSDGFHVNGGSTTVTIDNLEMYTRYKSFYFQKCTSAKITINNCDISTADQALYFVNSCEKVELYVYGGTIRSGHKTVQGMAKSGTYVFGKAGTTGPTLISDVTLAEAVGGTGGVQQVFAFHTGSTSSPFTVTVNSGIYTTSSGYMFDMNENAKGSITINGGTFNMLAGGNVIDVDGSGTNPSYVDVTITGGEFVGARQLIHFDQTTGKILISGGTGSFISDGTAAAYLLNITGNVAVVSEGSEISGGEYTVTLANNSTFGMITSTNSTTTTINLKISGGTLNCTNGALFRHMGKLNAEISGGDITATSILHLNASGQSVNTVKITGAPTVNCSSAPFLGDKWDTSNKKYATTNIEITGAVVLTSANSIFSFQDGHVLNLKVTNGTYSATENVLSFVAVKFVGSWGGTATVTSAKRFLHTTWGMTSAGNFVTDPKGEITDASMILEVTGGEYTASARMFSLTDRGKVVVRVSGGTFNASDLMFYSSRNGTNESFLDVYISGGTLNSPNTQMFYTLHKMDVHISGGTLNHSKTNTNGGFAYVNLGTDTSKAKTDEGYITQNGYMTLYISGGTINAPQAPLIGGAESYPADVTHHKGINTIIAYISGGTINTYAVSNVNGVSSTSATISGSAVLNLTNSVFADMGSKAASSQTITMEGGTVNAPRIFIQNSSNTPTTFTMTGGTYNGATFVANEEGVVANGTTYYPGLQAAINAANDGDTLTIVGGITITEPININKSLTIEGGTAQQPILVVCPNFAFTKVNGAYDTFRIAADKSVTFGGYVEYVNCGIQVDSGATEAGTTVTFKDNVVFDNNTLSHVLTNTATEGNVTVNIQGSAHLIGNYGIAFDHDTSKIAGNKYVNITGGTITANHAVVFKTDSIVGHLYVENGTFVVNNSMAYFTTQSAGNTVVIENADVTSKSQLIFVSNTDGVAGGTVTATINGGTFATSGTGSLFNSSTCGGSGVNVNVFTVNIYGGSFTNTSESGDFYMFYATDANGALRANIYGGTITAAGAGNHTFARNHSDAMIINIYGGKISGFTYFIAGARRNTTVLIDSYKDEEGNVLATPEISATYVFYGKYDYTASGNSAGDNIFLNVTVNAGTITATESMFYTDNSTRVATNTYTVNGGTLNAKHLLHTVSGTTTMTVAGGTVSTSDNAILLDSGNAELSISGGDFTATKYFIYQSDAHSGTLSISVGSATVNAEYGIGLNSKTADASVTVRINGMNMTVAKAGIRVYNLDELTLTVETATITASGNAYNSAEPFFIDNSVLVANVTVKAGTYKALGSDQARIFYGRAMDGTYVFGTENGDNTKLTMEATGFQIFCFHQVGVNFDVTVYSGTYTVTGSNNVFDINEGVTGEIKIHGGSFSTTTGGNIIDLAGNANAVSCVDVTITGGTFNVKGHFLVYSGSSGVANISGGIVTAGNYGIALGGGPISISPSITETVTVREGVEALPEVVINLSGSVSITATNRVISVVSNMSSLVNIEGGTYTTTAGGGYLIYRSNDYNDPNIDETQEGVTETTDEFSVFNISGGTFNAQCENMFAMGNFTFDKTYTVINISGGSFNQQKTSGNAIFFHNWDWNGNAIINVSGGTFTGTESATVYGFCNNADTMWIDITGNASFTGVDNLVWANRGTTHVEIGADQNGNAPSFTVSGIVFYDYVSNSNDNAGTLNATVSAGTFSCAQLLLSQKSTNAAYAHLTVTGGTYTVTGDFITFNNASGIVNLSDITINGCTNGFVFTGAAPSISKEITDADKVQVSTSPALNEKPDVIVNLSGSFSLTTSGYAFTANQGTDAASDGGISTLVNITGNGVSLTSTLALFHRAGDTQNTWSVYNIEGGTFRTDAEIMLAKDLLTKNHFTVMNISGGSFTAGGATLFQQTSAVEGDKSYAIINISGGSFSSTKSASKVIFFSNNDWQGTMNVNITGGTFSSVGSKVNQFAYNNGQYMNVTFTGASLSFSLNEPNNGLFYQARVSCYLTIDVNGGSLTCPNGPVFGAYGNVTGNINGGTVTAAYMLNENTANAHQVVANIYEGATVIITSALITDGTKPADTDTTSHVTVNIYGGEVSSPYYTTGAPMQVRCYVKFHGDCIYNGVAYTLGDAKILLNGGSEYLTLEAALADAVDGDVLTLTQSFGIVSTIINKSVTITGNEGITAFGKGGVAVLTVTNNASVTFNGYTAFGQVSIVGEGGTTVTIAGNVRFANDKRGEPVYKTAGSGTVTLNVQENAYLSGFRAISILNGVAADINVTGGTIDANGGAFYIANKYVAELDNVIDIYIKDATITATYTTHSELYASKSKITVEGNANIYSADQGFYYNTTGPQTGTDADGKALYESPCYHNTEIVINGGTFNIADTSKHIIDMNDGVTSKITINGGDFNTDKAASAYIIDLATGCNAEITITGGTVHDSKYLLCFLGSTVDLTITGGTFNTHERFMSATGDNSRLDAVISGCTINQSDNGNGGHSLMFYVNNQTVANITINGGVFNNTSTEMDEHNATFETQSSSNNAATLNVTLNGGTFNVHNFIWAYGGSVSVKGDGATVNAVNYTVGNTTGYSDATRGTVYVTNLKTAVEKAAAGATIYFMNNQTVSATVAINKKLTFTGNAVKVSGSVILFTVTGNTTVIFDGDVSYESTLSIVKINALAADDTTAHDIAIQFLKGNFKSTSTSINGAILWDADGYANTTLTITAGATLISNGYAIAFQDNQDTEFTGTKTVNMTGGSVEGSYAIVFNIGGVSADLNISGGTLSNTTGNSVLYFSNKYFASRENVINVDLSNVTLSGKQGIRFETRASHANINLGSGTVLNCSDIGVIVTNASHVTATVTGATFNVGGHGFHASDDKGATYDITINEGSSFPLTGYTKSCIDINPGNTLELTINGGTFTAGGLGTNSTSGKQEYAGHIIDVYKSAATITINDGTFTAANTYILNLTGGTANDQITIAGGEFKAKRFMHTSAKLGTMTVNNNPVITTNERVLSFDGATDMTVTFNGGTVTSDDVNGGHSLMFYVTGTAQVDLIINSGTFNNLSTETDEHNSVFEVNNNANNKLNVTLNGGTINAHTLIWVYNGSVTVTGDSTTINCTRYSADSVYYDDLSGVRHWFTIASAAANAPDGTTLTIPTNIKTSSTASITKNLTFTGDGVTITATKAVFQVAGGHLTLSGNVTYTSTGSVVSFSQSAPTSKLTVQSGSFETTGAEGNVFAVGGYTTGGSATIEITGGSFSGYRIFNVSNNYSETAPTLEVDGFEQKFDYVIKVSGGEFTSTNRTFSIVDYSHTYLEISGGSFSAPSGNIIYHTDRTDQTDATGNRGKAYAYFVIMGDAILSSVNNVFENYDGWAYLTIKADGEGNTPTLTSGSWIVYTNLGDNTNNYTYVTVLAGTFLDHGSSNPGGFFGNSANATAEKPVELEINISGGTFAFAWEVAKINGTSNVDITISGGEYDVSRIFYMVGSTFTADVDLEISGGSFTTKNSAVYGDIGTGNNDVTVTLTGDTVITSTTSIVDFRNGHTLTLTVSGGTYTADYSNIVVICNATANLTGGTFKGLALYTPGALNWAPTIGDGVVIETEHRNYHYVVFNDGSNSYFGSLENVSAVVPENAVLTIVGQLPSGNYNLSKSIILTGTAGNKMGDALGQTKILLAEGVSITFLGDIVYTNVTVYANNDTTVTFGGNVRFENGTAYHVFEDQNANYNSTVIVRDNAYLQGNYTINFHHVGTDGKDTYDFAATGTKTVKLYGGTLDANYGIVFNVDDVTADIDLTGGLIDAKQTAIYLNSRSMSGHRFDLLIDGITIEADNLGIDVIDNRILMDITVKSGTIHTYSYCIEFLSASNEIPSTLVILGGTFISTNADAAIHVSSTDNANTKAEAPIAKIYAGYFEAYKLCCARATNGGWLEIWGGYFNFLGAATGGGSPVRAGTSGGTGHVDVFGGSYYTTDKGAAINCANAQSYLTVHAEGVTAVGGAYLVGGNTNAATQYYPDGDHEHEGTISMTDGAGVRLYPNSNGLRFVSVVTAEALNYIRNVLGGTNLRFGTLIAPADEVAKAKGFTLELMDAAGAQYVDIPAESGLVARAAGGYYIRAALVNIREENIDREFAAVGYVQFEVGDMTFTSYTAYREVRNARSIEQVARLALKEADKYTPAQQAILREFAPTEAAPVIDFYLVAGQSNAAGSSNWNDNIMQLRPEYYEGFSHILYSGSSNQAHRLNTVTKLGYGSAGDTFGPELGMADALSQYYNEETGRYAAIIKYAYGGTNLYDSITGSNAPEGNWLPPSWIEAMGAKDAHLSGGLFRALVNHVENSINEYEAMGFDVNIVAAYWMQGESDTGNHAKDGLYDDIFKCWVGDLRASIVEMTGEERYEQLPILVGEISEYFSGARNNPTSYQNCLDFVKMQREIIGSWENVYVISNGNIPTDDHANDVSHWGYHQALWIGQHLGQTILTELLGQEVVIPEDRIVAELWLDGELIGVYSELAGAINQAPAGSVVKILKDLDMYSNMVIGNRNKFTIDGNGHTLTFKTADGSDNSYHSAIKFFATDVTIKDLFVISTNNAWGSQLFLNSSVTWIGGGFEAQELCFVMNDHGALNIHGGEFTTRGTTNSGFGVIYLGSAKTQTLTITDGTFNAGATGAGSAVIITGSTVNDVITITGGTFIGAPDTDVVIDVNSTSATLNIDSSNITVIGGTTAGIENSGKTVTMG